MKTRARLHLAIALTLSSLGAAVNVHGGEPLEVVKSAAVGKHQNTRLDPFHDPAF
jgi:hypothetical protein